MLNLGIEGIFVVGAMMGWLVAYLTGSLSKWKGGGMYGYIVKRGKKKLVTKELVKKQLGLIVRMMRRPAMEGG